MTKPLTVQFPRKLSFLLTEPHRYKCARGGRGSAKSWSFARALLLEGARKPLRILCAREIQKTIKDSVHKLLSDQVVMMGLTGHYDVLESIIRGRNGTEFLYTGLSNVTEQNLKSFEGCDRAWLEEAQNISTSSWQILTPTIRKPGSEIWVTYNPVLETDPTHQRMVAHPAPDTMCVEMNWRDNPFFTEVMEQERLHCLATESEEDYLWIWEGQCRSAVVGAIYAAEVAKASSSRRIGLVPYDPMLKVHTIWDMGFGDNMCVIFAQRLRSEIRIIDYLQVRQKRTDEVGMMVKGKLYNWGKCFLPHDGFAEVRQGANDATVLGKLGIGTVVQTPGVSVESGIRNARNNFQRCVFDNRDMVNTTDHQEGVWHLLECLKRYRRAETKHGGDGQPVHDIFSHGADSFRYLCLNLEDMTNEDDYTEGPTIHAPQPHGTMGMC